MALCASMLLWLPPLLCSAVYAPCVAYSEWYIDELFAVLRNADARGESLLSEVLTNDFWGNPLRGAWTHKSYRPLSVLSFAWQFALLSFGAQFRSGALDEAEPLYRPQPLRAFNAALHAANALLVLALLRQLRLSRLASCLGACLFAAHPVHVENIVYLVGRADCLATTGWLLAALLQLKVRAARPRGSPKRLLGSCLLLLACGVLAVLAGLCKESGLTLLVFVAGVELCSRGAGAGARASSAGVGAGGWAAAAGALVLFAALTVARFRITEGTAAGFGFVDTPVQYQTEAPVRAWTYMFQHSFYSKLLVLPGALSWDYSFDAVPMLRAEWRDLRALGICAAYLGLCALAAWSLTPRSGSRRMLLGLQTVIVPFVPASNLFFVVGVTIGERLLYPSTVGAALAFAAWADHRPTMKPEDRSPASRARSGGGDLSDGPQPPIADRRPAPRWRLAAGLLLLLAYLHGCSLRVWQWRSSEALYEADALSWPGSVKTQHQLATVYHAMSRYDEALKHYAASLSILDDNALTDHCIGQIYIETGRYAAAVERFEKIFRGHGVGFSQFNLWMLYVDYGFALVALGRQEEAIPLLQEGLRRNTAVPHGLNALGYAYASLRQLQEAQDTFAQGLEYDPDNPVIWGNLAAVWLGAGALEQAVQGLEKALALEPGNPVLLYNAALLQEVVQRGGGDLPRVPRLDLFFSRMA